MQRAREAEALLHNPVLNDAIKSIESGLLAQMRAVKLDDVQAHTRLILAYQLNREVQQTLWSQIQDGHAAGEVVQMRGKRLD